MVQSEQIRPRKRKIRNMITNIAYCMTSLTLLNSALSGDSQAIPTGNVDSSTMKTQIPQSLNTEPSVLHGQALYQE